MNIYQAKVVYAKIGHGTTTENYLVKAHNLTEVEVLIKEAVQKRAINDTPIEVKTIAKKKFDAVIHAPAGKDDDVRYYVVKVIDEDEKEALHKYTYLVTASSLGEAYETTYNEIPCERTLSIGGQGRVTTRGEVLSLSPSHCFGYTHHGSAEHRESCQYRVEVFPGHGLEALPVERPHYNRRTPYCCTSVYREWRKDASQARWHDLQSRTHE